MLLYSTLATIEDRQERQKIANIYEEHCHKCFYVALKILKNQELAEDAVSDAFIRGDKTKR